MEQQEIVYSKITGKRRPPSTIIKSNELNMELFAKMLIRIYNRHKEEMDNDTIESA